MSLVRSKGIDGPESDTKDDSMRGRMVFMCNEIKRCFGMNSSKFNELLNEVVQDIEEHIILLEEIKKIVDYEQNKGKMKHPVFKYQSPDAWLKPSHSQKTGHVIG